MSSKTEITLQEKFLIKELACTITEIDSQNNLVKELIFRGLASYVEGIKVGLNFQKMSLQTEYTKN